MNNTNICPNCGHQEFKEEEIKKNIELYNSVRNAIIDSFLEGSKFGLEQARKIFNDDKRGLDKDQVLKDAQPYIEELVNKHNSII